MSFNIPSSQSLPSKPLVAPCTPSSVQPRYQHLFSHSVHHVPSSADHEVYSVIRDLVPPPPAAISDPHAGKTGSCISSEIPFLDPSSEQLFTRRPSEESLMRKCFNQLFSAPETQRNLQELLVEILLEKKYSQENDVMYLISCALQKWPADICILRNALACMVCLNSHNNEFQLPLIWAQNVIEIMNKSEFCLDEPIQRSGVKLLQNPKILEKLNRKFELACVLLNALCRIPEVDDFMGFTKHLVQNLQPHEKRKIKNVVLYVEMLVEFPLRVNHRITVPLCWSALDVLLTLAECDLKWETLLKVGGIEKLQKLSLRPELKDHCDAILKFVDPIRSSEDVICLTPSVPVISQDLIRSSGIEESTLAQPFNERHPSCLHEAPLSAKQVLPGHYERRGLPSVSASIQNKQNSKADCKTHSALYAWVLPSEETHNSRKSLCRMQQEPFSKENMEFSLLNKEEFQFVPIDAVLTRNAPTPPPILADVSDDIDGQFSDDEHHQEDQSSSKTQHQYTPLFCESLSLSPSYSPPPPSDEINSQDKSLAANNIFSAQRPALSEKTRLLNSRDQTNFPLLSYKNSSVQRQKRRNVQSMRFSRSKYSCEKGKLLQCVFCKEPKVKQISLVEQLKQMHPYLLQSGCVDLFNCLNFNLCKQHKIKKSR